MSCLVRSTYLWTGLAVKFHGQKKSPVDIDLGRLCALMVDLIRPINDFPESSHAY